MAPKPKPRWAPTLVLNTPLASTLWLRNAPYAPPESERVPVAGS
jgi:hypothetical protein